MRYVMSGLALLLSLSLVAADGEAQEARGKYQIMKATQDRVWRLNTETGEIAVCALEGENLVCTTTSDAAEVPKKSYAEIEAARQADAEKAAAERAERRERELKLLDKILAFFREMLATALGDQGGG